MPNRLIHEKSPYLLQHAHNPVDWYPWGEEAFEAARRRGCPVLVSIGYATCHWCHVMERESFEDPEIAILMNRAFVNIKVDREERPDVDGIYMTVCQVITGHGGWPLNVLLTPDQKPFFAATYIPPTSRHGRLGMRELVPRVEQIWTAERKRMESSADELTEMLNQEAAADLSGELPQYGSVSDAVSMLERQFDRTHGGFGTAPKFPMPHNMTLLLRHWHRTREQPALEMVTETLTSMARGGIFDHLGFGFHRYSTDAKWLVPHFEKMLYDQALLIPAYLDAYQITGQESFADIARKSIEYVDRDLGSPEGGFYSAEDADSEGEEGKFYLWRLADFEAVLGEEEAGTAAAIWSLTEDGNYRDEVTASKTGANIPHRTLSDDELATALDVLPDELNDHIDRLRERLFEARSSRERPLRDEKVLTDWNGLAIAAFAQASVVLNVPGYAERAARAASFVLDRMKAPDGGLLHRYKDGEASFEGTLDDYAFFVHGLIELYLAEQDARWLAEAKALTDLMLERFSHERGALYFTSESAEKLITRRREIQDGAVPSGNAMAVINLTRLGRILVEPRYEDAARSIVSGLAQSIRKFPTAHAMLLANLAVLLDESAEVVIAGADSEATRALLQAARRTYHPNRVIVTKGLSKENDTLLAKLIPAINLYEMVDGRPAAYVCRRMVCEAPVTDVAGLDAALG